MPTTCVRRGIPPMLLLAGVVACHDPVEPLFERPQASARAKLVAESRLRSAHDDLDDLAKSIPGFGGLYFDAGSRLNVYLQDPAQTRTAIRTLNRFFAGRTVNLEGTTRVNVNRAVFRQGDYAWSQLREWAGQLSAIVSPSVGLVYFTVSEKRNRILIAVQSADHRGTILTRIAGTSVPAAAVDIVITQPLADLSHSLHYGFEPVVGAVRVEWVSGSAFECTHGFNARQTGFSLTFFVTNAHCAADPHNPNDLTPFYQPSSPSFFIGRREYTAPTFNNSQNAECPVEYRACRYSDAALVAYTAADRTSKLAAIARTETSGQWSGSILVNHTQPEWRITQEAAYPFAGEFVSKTGIATGWTYGQVDSPDGAFYSTAQDVLYLRQASVIAGGNAGDSGAPVFGQITGSDVRLFGVVWAATPGEYYVFSPMGEIEYELGALTTF